MNVEFTPNRICIDAMVGSYHIATSTDTRTD